jgi:coproporphyrinogen III oxidase-like Fe-S oxidoreductase
VASCIDELVDAGLLDRSADRAILTRRGRLLGNEAAARLLLASERDHAGAGTR